MRRVTASLLSLPLFALAGCLGRTVPLPPPVASASFVSCDPKDCGPDGVLVTITGFARVGALVVAENLDRRLPGDARYIASAYASTTPVGDAGTEASGAFSIEMRPVPVPGDLPVATHVGDRLRVYELVRNVDNSFEQSDFVDLTVR